MIRIGTSGWHYPHWYGVFYPNGLSAEHQLRFYASRLDTVELNNSFYRLPSRAAVDRWRAATPRHFCFAVKGSRFLTHMKKLKDPEPGLGNFLPRVEPLADKLGPILFQLPPRWGCDIDRLTVFLRALPARHRYGFELRDPSWHVPAVYRLLSRFNAACCAYDLAGFQSPITLTADFAYIRLHGPEGRYQGRYSAEALSGWARRIQRWAGSLRAVYVYFDNDQRGFAVENALELRRLVTS